MNNFEDMLIGGRKKKSKRAGSKKARRSSRKKSKRSKRSKSKKSKRSSRKKSRSGSKRSIFNPGSDIHSRRYDDDDLVDDDYYPRRRSRRRRYYDDGLFVPGDPYSDIIIGPSYFVTESLSDRVDRVVKNTLNMNNTKSVRDYANLQPPSGGKVITSKPYTSSGSTVRDAGTQTSTQEGRVAQVLGASQQQMMAPQMMAPQMMAPQMMAPQMHPQMMAPQMAPQMHQQMQEGAPMQVNKAQIHKHFFGEGMPQGLNDVPQGLADMPQIEKTSGQINLNPNGASTPGQINLNPNNLNEILPSQSGGARKIRVSLIKF